MNFLVVTNLNHSDTEEMSLPSSNVTMISRPHEMKTICVENMAVTLKMSLAVLGRTFIASIIVQTLLCYCTETTHFSSCIVP